MLYLHVTNHLKIDTLVAVNHKNFAGLSTHYTCFGRTDHLQAFKYMIFKT